MKLFSYIVIAVVAVSVIGGFFIVGSPGDERARRFDEERVSHLQTIQGEVVYYWQNKEVLPKNLDELTDSIRGFRAPMDPETGASYTYTVKNDLLFELCATFVTTSTGYKNPDVPIPAMPISRPYLHDPYSSTWEHGIGKTCFEREIDPDIYKPFPKQ